MALFQRTLAATAAAAALAGAFTLPVWAQNAPAPQGKAVTAPDGARHHAPRPPMDRAAMHTKHMEHLKPLLQLTAAQEGAWNKYVEATRPGERKAHMDREAWSKLTTPQRIEQAQTLRKERNAKAEQRENATKTFYASLNPAQQKAFDVAMPLRGHGMKHGMHKAGHRQPGGHAGHPGQGPRPMQAPAGS